MLEVGKVISLEDGYEIEDNAHKHKRKQYRVLEILRYTVLLEDRHGFKRCVPKGELIRMGYLRQAPHLETLRAERNERYKGYTRSFG